MSILCCCCCCFGCCRCCCCWRATGGCDVMSERRRVTIQSKSLIRVRVILMWFGLGSSSGVRQMSEQAVAKVAVKHKQ